MAGGSPATAQLRELLAALRSPEDALRRQAEALYAKAKKGDPDSLLMGLASVLGDQEATQADRHSSAVLLRNLVNPSNGQDFIFVKAGDNTRTRLPEELLQHFKAEHVLLLQRQIGHTLAKLIEFVCDPSDPRGWLHPESANGWPALLPTLLRMAAGAAEGVAPYSQESSLRLLADLVWLITEDSEALNTMVPAAVQAGLAHPDVGVRAAALKLACAVLGEIGAEGGEAAASPGMALLAGTLPEAIRSLARASIGGNEDPLESALQAMVDLVARAPDAFRPTLLASLEPASSLAELAKGGGAAGVGSGCRGLALEWLVAYTEQRPKWLAKQLPAFASVAFEVCMTLMLETDISDSALNEWVARRYDEEGEEDVDETFHAAEQAVDRLVRALGIAIVWQPFSAIASQYAQRTDWQARHALLGAIRQTAEFVEEPSHLNSMSSLVLQHFEHAHPRVRNAALHALGQLANDQAPHFQESHHSIVIPALIRMMDDPVDRVAAMAMSSFISFGEELDNALMAAYVRPLLDTFARKLQTTQHRSVREESITSIAVLAEVAGKDFSLYYESIMPVLKRLVQQSTGPKEQRLRGKAFECISLLGIAVGPERFSTDAADVVAEMARTNLSDDDVQREYIKQASERICHCLKRGFAAFLPTLLPGILQPLRFADAAGLRGQQPGDDADEDEDEYVRLTVGDGAPIMVRTQVFEHVLQSVQLVYKFVLELDGAYFNWVPSTAEALLPLLSLTEEVSAACDAAWTVALRTWALLIKAARSGAAERNETTELPQTLLRTVLQRVFPMTEHTEEPEALGSITSGLAECVKNSGSGSMTPEELRQLASGVFSLLERSFARSAEHERLRQKLRRSGNRDEGDDDENVEDEQESRCRLCYEQLLAAAMEVGPDEFARCLSELTPRLEAWLGNRRGCVPALALAGDLLLHLGERSRPLWGLLVPGAFRALRSADDADARGAAAYVVNVAAPLPGFAEAAPEAFRCLAQAVSGKKPGRKDVKARVALDHAASALFNLARLQPSACPSDVKAWSLIAGLLPLRDDGDEAKKVHMAVVDLVLQGHSGILGGDRREHLGQVLGALAEIYGNSSLCEEETCSKIQQVFRQAPREDLQNLAAHFTEKQQKKIEKMLLTTCE